MLFYSSANVSASRKTFPLNRLVWHVASVARSQSTPFTMLLLRETIRASQIWVRTVSVAYLKSAKYTKHNIIHFRMPARFKNAIKGSLQL